MVLYLISGEQTNKQTSNKTPQFINLLLNLLWNFALRENIKMQS